MQYEVDGWRRLTEENDHETGCMPETGCTSTGPDRFEAGSIEDLIVDKLMPFVGSNDAGGILRDACDEEGRIDIQVMEDEDGVTASEHEVEEWRAGRGRLWSACYTFRVEEVERKIVSAVDGTAAPVCPTCGGEVL